MNSDVEIFGLNVENAAAKNFSAATFSVDRQSISRILCNGNHLSCLNVAAQV